MRPDEDTAELINATRTVKEHWDDFEDDYDEEEAYPVLRAPNPLTVPLMEVMRLVPKRK